jgi:hypothetical protein
MALVALSCCSSAFKSSVIGATGAGGAATDDAAGFVARAIGGGVLATGGVSLLAACGVGVAAPGADTAAGSGCGVTGATGLSAGCGVAGCVATTGVETVGSGVTRAQPPVSSNSRTAVYLTIQSRPVKTRTTIRMVTMHRVWSSTAEDLCSEQNSRVVSDND